MRIKFFFKVVPNSNDSRIIGDIIKVKSPAREGKANKEVIKLICKKYKVSHTQVKLLGRGSRKKVAIIEKDL